VVLCVIGTLNETNVKVDVYTMTGAKEVEIISNDIFVKINQ
jgi:hypothetical protein